MLKNVLFACAAAFALAVTALAEDVGQIGKPKPPEPDIIGAGGEFTTSYEIKIPAYRGLPLPVSLNYNSSNTARGGVDNTVGFGWSLSAFSTIERKSLGGGVPTFQDGQDLFVMDGDELMACYDTAATNKWTASYPLRYRTDRSSASCSAGGNFSTRIESYKRIVYSPETNSFAVTRPDGTRLTYQSLATLTGDTSAAGTDQWKLANQTRWLLTEVRDAQPTANVVTYSYGFAAAQYGYAPRILNIEYGGYKVEFRYRTYSSLNAVVPKFATGTGFIGSQHSQLRSIRILDGTTKVRAYQIFHTASGFSKTQLVSGITEYGSNFTFTGSDITGGSALPGTLYSYSPDNWSLTELNPSNTPALVGREIRHPVAILDWDRDGTDDLWFKGSSLPLFRLKPDRSGFSTTPQISGNCGTIITEANSGSQLGYSYPTILGNDRTTDAQYCLLYHWYNYTYGTNENPATDFYLYSSRIGETQPPYSSERHLGYGGWRNLNPPSVEAIGNFDLDPDTELQFGRMMYDVVDGRFIPYEANPANLPLQTMYVFDINGDGVDDFVDGGSRYLTVPETGEVDGVLRLRSSWREKHLASNLTPSNGINILISLGLFNGNQSVGFSGYADMNGDGLLDIVHFVSSWFDQDFLMYFPSNGDSFGSPVILPFPDISGITELGHVQTSTGEIGFPTPRPNPKLSLRDVNGDGLTDVYATLQFAPSGYPGHTIVQQKTDVWVFLNNGTSFVPFSHDGVANVFHDLIATGDFDGDGLTDFAMSGSDVAPTSGALPLAGSTPKPRLLMGTGGLPNRMTSVTNPYGGKMTVAYTSSAEFGTNQMPGVQQVVKSITRDDGRGGVATTTYSYVGGKYDFINRRTLGYTTVTASLPAIAGESAGPQVVTIYENDNIAEYGNVKSRTFVHQGVTQSQEIYDYTTVVSGNGPWLSVRSKARQSVLYGTESVETTKTFTTSSYGQPVTATNFGQTANGVDLDATDTVTESFGYTPNLAAYIVDRPAFRQVQRALAQTEDRTLWLSREAYFYDGATAYLSAPPAIGNLTRVQQWNGNLAATTLRTAKTLTYDGRGNVLTEVNGLNATTSYSYDTAKALFVTSTTNALGHASTAVWNTGCQTPTRQTDANGDAVQITLDTFCRETRRDEAAGNYLITSYTSLGQPTAQFIENRTLSGSTLAGQGVKVTRSYFDGFGRTYKSVSPGASADTADDVAVLTEFDARGNVHRQSLPLPGATITMPIGTYTTYTYDPLGRPLTKTHPDGNRAETRYVAPAKQIMGAAAQNYPSVTQLDEDCFDTSTTTPCVEYTESFDAEGRRVAQTWYDRALTDVDAGGTVERSTHYRYSPDGDLLEIRDPVGATWLYTYDAFGNRLTANDPGLGY